jgi:hypothetical protein
VAGIEGVHLLARRAAPVPYSHDRPAIRLKRLNVTLISSINRTPELRRWIEDGLVALG